MSSYEGFAYANGSATSGGGVSKVWLGGVACTGSEASLLDCPRNSAMGTLHTCYHGNVARVSCPAAGNANQLRQNCSRLPYLPERGAVPCSCSTQSLGSPPGRLRWKLGSTVIATGTVGVLELIFPSNRATRHDEGQIAVCELEQWQPYTVDLTTRVAYGPDAVNITFRDLYDVGGERQVIVTCLVSAVNPKDDSMVEWSGPCQGQRGFTCTLSSPVSGQGVTCRVTNKDNNNHSLEATAYLPLPISATAGRVNVSYTQLYNDKGQSYVIVSCHVTGLQPLVALVVQWSGPCQGHTGFTCTLMSPSSGQRVTCKVNHAGHSNHSFEGGVTLILNEFKFFKMDNLLHQNCSRLAYIPERGVVPCSCFTQSLVSPSGRLRWKLGSTIIANGTLGERDLIFPSDRVTRHDDGRISHCELDLWERYTIDLTTRVAYGPDAVNINFRDLYDVNGERQVTVTCLVEVMNPKDDSMVEWSGPCQGQRGFTCTLSSPVSGQRVTCRVTNTDNNNHSLEATAYLPLPVFGAESVNISYTQLYSNKGESYVIITCHVTGVQTVVAPLVQWSGPCDGHTGFTCTLMSPSNGQNVTCKVTNPGHTDLSVEGGVTIHLQEFKFVDAGLLTVVIVGGGAVGVVLLIALLVFVILYLMSRRRHHHLTNNSATDGSVVMRGALEKRESHTYSSLSLTASDGPAYSGKEPPSKALTSDPPPKEENIYENTEMNTMSTN